MIIRAMVVIFCLAFFRGSVEATEIEITYHGNIETFPKIIVQSGGAVQTVLRRQWSYGKGKVRWQRIRRQC